jgi:hypothetical protein
MKQSIGGKSASEARKRPTHERESRHKVPPHPCSAAIISSGKEAEQDPDEGFVEGGQAAIDPNLRHRLISEAAFRRFADRGYADGCDVDDWLEAEAEIDHLRPNPGLQSRPQSAA